VLICQPGFAIQNRSCPRQKRPILSMPISINQPPTVA
jgi:hypothetical protein